MNSKITFVELVNLMAEATSTNKRVCELFLKDMFATISQELINGENVKIKGVGTFKVIKVKPRKSVNVKTGEPVQIAGYNKVTFTPDKALADAVNQPFAQFVSVVLDDAVTDERLAEIDKLHPSAITAPEAVDEKLVDMGQELEYVNADPEPQIDEMDIPPVAPFPMDFPEVQEAASEPATNTLFESKSDVEKAHDVANEPEKPEPAKEELVEKTHIEETPVEKITTSEVMHPEKEAPAVIKEPVKEETSHITPVKSAVPERKPMLVGRPIDGPTQPVPEPEKAEEVASDRRFYRPEPRNVYTPTPEQIEEASRKPDRRWLWFLLTALAATLLFWLIARGCSDNQIDQHELEVVAADTIVDDDESIAEAKSEVKSEPKAEPKPEPKPEVKPEPKPEVKPEPKPEVKPEPKAETKPEVKPLPQAKAETKPVDKDKVVTDVVTSQIVLTTLSEKHYGSPWFWVYIYEENVARGIINDPNNIKPGTRVVIPPRDKYGINPKDKASLRKAQLKSMQYLKGK